MTLDQKLLLYAQQFEDQHAPENITTTLREAADEIERLRAALEEVRVLVFGANHSEARYPLARAALECKHD